MWHLFAKYTRGKEPLIDHSMSNVFVMFNEYLDVLLMDKALVKEFREKSE
jgi:hypothetical protein